MFQTNLILFYFQAGGLSSLTGSASSPYIPSSDFSPLPPMRPGVGMPPNTMNPTMFRHNVHTSHSISGGLAGILDQPPHYSLASPQYEGHVSSSHGQAAQDHLGVGIPTTHHTA